ncbi:MAG: hypothetical protein NZM43_08275, partial [Saprospiraceae bacterium]|nr:hypothetical protein [Saprospiraceae bacterium]MDW8484305.1 hypothetical protein [Saprospiraceae bacterium]
MVVADDIAKHRQAVLLSVVVFQLGDALVAALGAIAVAVGVNADEDLALLDFGKARLFRLLAAGAKVLHNDGVFFHAAQGVIHGFAVLLEVCEGAADEYAGH